jgi:hypothetical protein
MADEKLEWPIIAVRPALAEDLGVASVLYGTAERESAWAWASDYLKRRLLPLPLESQLVRQTRSPLPY